MILQSARRLAAPLATRPTLRARRPAAAPGGDNGPERRRCVLSPDALRRLGIEDGALVEILAPGGPSLRAWATEDSEITAGSVRLGRLAKKILRASEGTEVQVRALAEPGS